MLHTLILAAVAFIITNIDDLFLLTFWFLRGIPFRTVILGQITGFTVIVVFSLVGLYFGLMLPPSLVRWAGLLPIGIGLKQLVARTKAREQEGDSTLLMVSAVTVTNGSDNVAIYVPLFIKQPHDVVLMVAYFYVLLAFWVLVASKAATLLSAHARQATRWVSPLAIIALGIWILLR